MPKDKKSDWDLEHQFDLATTLGDLIDSPPFREASGDTGESVTAGTRIPTWMYRRINKFKETIGSPYEVVSDVLRDAIYIGLRVLSMRYSTNPDWAVESKMASIVDDASKLRRLKSKFSELMEGLESLWEDGDEGIAIEGLTSFINAALEYETPWYRQKLFSLLGGNKLAQEILKKCSPEVRSAIDNTNRS